MITYTHRLSWSHSTEYEHRPLGGPFKVDHNCNRNTHKHKHRVWGWQEICHFQGSDYSDWASVTCTHSERTNIHTQSINLLYSTPACLQCHHGYTSPWLHNIYIHCYRSKPQIHKMLCPHSSLTPICKVYCSAIRVPVVLLECLRKDRIISWWLYQTVIPWKYTMLHDICMILQGITMQGRFLQGGNGGSTCSKYWKIKNL